MTVFCPLDQGIYIDGHEREDVEQYRRFLRQLVAGGFLCRICSSPDSCACASQLYGIEENFGGSVALQGSAGYFQSYFTTKRLLYKSVNHDIVISVHLPAFM